MTLKYKYMISIIFKYICIILFNFNSFSNNKFKSKLAEKTAELIDQLKQKEIRLSEFDLKLK